MHLDRRSIALSLALALSVAGGPSAEEGMWPLNRFPADALRAKYGFTPSPAWLEQVQLGSVRFAEGCSGSFVSPGGLVMTNYHCIVQCVDAVSTKERNFAATGFSAAAQGDEVRCPGMELNQLTAITDVSDRVASATKGKEGEAFADARRAVFAAIEKECATGDEVRCDVVTLYRGGKYDLYKYRRFQDVRLVFAPEFDVGFFGGDPDNFMFPRYNLDVSFVRVYEGGRPLAAKHWFRWAPDGGKPGDLAFVSGHPGGTSRLFTVPQLEFERDVRLPSHLQFFTELRGLLTEFQRRGPEQARVAGSQIFMVGNTIKVMRGQFEALANPGLMAQKRSQEEALRRDVRGRAELESRFGGAWEAIEKIMGRKREVWPRFAAFSRLATSDLFQLAVTLVRLAEEQAKPNGERLPEFTDAALPAVRQHLEAERPYPKDLETMALAYFLTHLREQLGLDDPATRALLGRRSPDEVAGDAIKGTTLDRAEARVALMKGGQAAIDASTDPLIALAKAIDPAARAARKAHEEQVDANLERNAELVAQALFALRGDSVYPDATFTLRVAYGTIKGWTEGGKEVEPFTTMAGLFERHTGSEPFKLTPRWLEAKARVTPSVPLNLITDVDIVGGNSGSPLLDREARIIGLIFDGNIHSIGGQYWFDTAKNRAIAVDARGIREALRSVYGAARVLEEIGRK
jgi:V8-like Glu-specific endopeptidase